MTITNLPYSYAKQFGVLIANDVEADAPITVYHRAIIESDTLLELQRYLATLFHLKEVDPETFQQKLSHIYASGTNTAVQVAADIGDDMDLAHLMQTMPKAEDLLESQDDAPIIRLLNALFTEAIKQGASDIHLEIFEKRIVIRYRIDGVLREVLEPARILAPMLVSRVKVMAKLDIAEKRLPQDGRISLHVAGHTVDLRVSTLPTTHGERIVMRILDKQQARLELESLGMAPLAKQQVEKLIQKPHGVILITGPTGSGKTTSLYAALTRLNTQERNILTVEDPIEFDLPGIGQTQVNLKADMTFARGLRAILRQDPDVVMIGEIRDLETAETAMQASLTGHLVLSTLHTNTAIGAITRLVDMGIEPFLIASSLLGTIAQRLVRVLCHDCKQAITADSTQCKILGISISHAPTIYQPRGCQRCNHTGYKGRTGIYEVIPMDDELRRLIHAASNEQALAAYAHEHHSTIEQDGIRRILKGDTSIAEVLRVTSIES